MKRTAQFFIITTVLVAGGLLLITNILASSASPAYDEVLKKHDPDILANLADRVETAWWNRSWNYRTAVVVEERNGTYLTNETVPLTIPAGRRINADCSDIRVIQQGTPMPWVNTTACNTPVGPDQDAVVQYRLDEGTGQWANDSSGSSHDAELGGDARLDQAADPSWVSGRTGTALSFDGSDDHVEGPSADTLPVGTGLTLTAWIRTGDANAGDGNAQGIVDTQESSDHGYRLAVEGGTVEFGLYAGDDGAGFTELNSNSRVDDGAWHHVAGTWNGTHMQVYVDGQQDGTATQSDLSESTQSLFIGVRDVTSGFFDGTIDEVRIYNRSLRPGVVHGLAQGGVSLNISANLTPSERTSDLYVYYGNDFAAHPRYDASSMQRTDLQDRPVAVSVGAPRTQEEIMDKVAEHVRQFDQHTGASITFDRGFGCDRISIRSPDTRLHKDFC